MNEACAAAARPAPEICLARGSSARGRARRGQEAADA